MPTPDPLASAPVYGLRRPRWYVRWRGIRWLRSGWCPCCYSSPPRRDCPVCMGHDDYGPGRLDKVTHAVWLIRWDNLTHPPDRRNP